MPAFLSGRLTRIDEYLAGCFRDLNLPPALREACEYALLSGGKRLRPLLAILCCECCDGDVKRVLPAAASTELIHAFSLVHDDLPAMDDDELRRGRPTLHIQFNEAMAILAGDALQALAFEQVCRCDLPAAQVAMLIRELADATTRMIAGQVYDTLGGVNASDPPRRQLEVIHRNKTGALIRAACRMGAIAADANGERLGSITRYGEAIGLMFQIVDDLIDVTQSSEHTGKATGKDAEAGKMTFPTLLGIDASKDEVDRLLRESIAALNPFGARGRPLAQLAEYLACRTR
jgi:geranylgeranyl diphosphate synthase type II